MKLLPIRLLLSVICIVWFGATIKAQNAELIKREWFVTTNMGCQMSGIKDEDFIKQNVAPLIDFSFGHIFTPELSLRVGYRGPYFKTISDKDKHHYNFFYGQALFDIKSTFQGYRAERIWDISLNVGAGYFYNLYYDRPNISAIVGLMNNFKISKSLFINIDLSAICAWDLYQNNADILPSASIGLSYRFDF